MNSETDLQPLLFDGTADTAEQYLFHVSAHLRAESNLNEELLQCDDEDQNFPYHLPFTQRINRHLMLPKE